MINEKEIESLRFDNNGLIPAIVKDAKSGKVLTLAYMNRESLKISIEKGLTCSYSRSRQELWLKGETSGNYQHIVSITADCDRDALVVLVEQQQVFGQLLVVLVVRLQQQDLCFELLVEDLQQDEPQFVVVWFVE